MSLYYKGLPAHMRAYANDRELEGFLGRLQALKNKVVMQSEIDNEDVGERLAQLEELKRAALERRAANKKPKVGQEGMSEADKQIIEDAKVREIKAKAKAKIKGRRVNKIGNILRPVIERLPPDGELPSTTTSTTTTTTKKYTGRGEYFKNNPGAAAKAAKKAVEARRRNRSRIELDKDDNFVETKKKATKNQ